MMAPFFLKRALAMAWATFLLHGLTVQAADLPPLNQLVSSYASERTTAGVMFDVEAKNDIVIYGVDINTIVQNSADVEMWTKEGTYKGYEKDASAWTLLFNSTLECNGIDVPTPIPTGSFDPVVMKASNRRSFYITFPKGASLRYITGNEEGQEYKSNDDLTIFEGIARRVGFDSAMYSPRVWSGGLNYLVGSPPTLEPTSSPTIKPTTGSPTPVPTRQPTASPTTEEERFKTFATSFDSTSTSAGNMFDITTKNDIVIHEIGINTYKKSDVNVQVWTKQGTYQNFDKDISAWTPIANVTVQGQGLNVPTMIPIGSFEPVTIMRRSKQAFYITCDGPYLRYSMGVSEGRDIGSNEDLILHEGVGKRLPITAATMSPRVWNGVIKYEVVVIPTPAPTTGAPTRDFTGLELATTTYYPTDDTYIQKGVESPQGAKALLLVDGTPKRVALFQFDISNLRGVDAIAKATLRVYALTDSPNGGDVSVIQDGYIDENSSTWDNVIYGSFAGIPTGSLGAVIANTYYDIDITKAFFDRIPPSFIVRLASTNSDGVMFRSTNGAVDNGPMLTIEFATPSNSLVMHSVFGTESPTPSPTKEKNWSNPPEPSNPPSRYFNYDPDSKYGPDNWDDVDHDRFWSQYDNLDVSLSDNRCRRGQRQSPRNLCRTSDECLEFHQPRPRKGEYDLDDAKSTVAKATPYIFHNKLRASYKERRNEDERPEPPGVDFARNGSTGPEVQDLLNIDIKVKSEHRLCNKQYDAEIQQYYQHYKGNIEALAILIQANGDHNGHFQRLLDFFQQKFDSDKLLCQRRQRRARALFGIDESSLEQATSKLRGSTDKNMNENDKADSDSVYQKILDRFLSLTQRRTADSWRWDPLEPGAILRSIHYWSYSGSMTEPPCFEGVRWRVIDVPMQISPGQYEQLKRLMFDHVDPDTCSKTSTHYEESNARPVQSYKGGAYYRCRRSDYVSDKERVASGKRRGFSDPKDWRGVGLLPYEEPEFPNV